MSHTMNRRGDKGAALGSTWSIFALLSISIIALFAVVAFSDAWRFCTFGRSSVMTSMTVSSGSLSVRVSYHLRQPHSLRREGQHAPLVPRRNPFLRWHKPVTSHARCGEPFQAARHVP